jgi:hypothetical protein
MRSTASTARTVATCKRKAADACQAPLGDGVPGHCPPRSTTRVAQIQAVVNAATDDRAVGELGPISGPDDARIARSDVQDAIGVATKGVVPLAPVHEDSDAPPI